MELSFADQLLPLFDELELWLLGGRLCRRRNGRLKVVDNAKAITAMSFMVQIVSSVMPHDPVNVERVSLCIGVGMDGADLPSLKSAMHQQPSNICRN